MHKNAAVNWISSFILICWLVDQLISSNIFLTKYFLRKGTQNRRCVHILPSSVAEQGDKVSLCLWHLTCLAGIRSRQDSWKGQTVCSMCAAHPCMSTVVLFKFGCSALFPQFSFVFSVYLHLLLSIHLFLLQEASYILCRWLHISHVGIWGWGMSWGCKSWSEGPIHADCSRMPGIHCWGSASQLHINWLNCTQSKSKTILL